MAISAVAASANVAGATGANITLSSPTGTTTGDVLVCVIALRGGTDTVTAVANGANSFTKLGFFTSSTTVTLSVWYRVVQAGDPTSWTITNTGNAEACMMAYRGVDNANPIDAQGTTTASTTINAVTVANANAWVIGLCAINNASGTVTATSMANQRANAGNGGGSTAKAAVWLGDSGPFGTGSSGSFTVTTSTTPSTTFAFSLKPAATGKAVAPPDRRRRLLTR